MPVLLPIPSRSAMTVPTFKDLEDARAFCLKLVQDYERFRSIVFQNTNRLTESGNATPYAAKDLEAEVKEQGQLLAALAACVLGDTLDGLTDLAHQFTTEDTRRIVSRYRHTKYGGPT